jgi:hypothetical protein
VAIFGVFFVAIFRPSNSARVAASLRKWGRAAPVCAFRLRGGANGGVVAFSLRVCGPANKWVVFQDASMILFIQLVWRARLLFDLRVCCLRFNHGIGTHCFATPCPQNGSIFRPWDWPAQFIDF